jgi:hypothetical protein
MEAKSRLVSMDETHKSRWCRLAVSYLRVVAPQQSERADLKRGGTLLPACGGIEPIAPFRPFQARTANRLATKWRTQPPLHDTSKEIFAWVSGRLESIFGANGSRDLDHPAGRAIWHGSEDAGIKFLRGRAGPIDRVVECRTPPASAWAQRLDEMRLIGEHEAWMAGFKDHLGSRIDHYIAQSTIEDADNAPHAGLGAMLPAQSRRQRILVEYCCTFIGYRRRWGARN